MATVVRTVTQVVTKAAGAATPSSTARAPPQGGVLEGGDPSHYDPKNPMILFIIQVRYVFECQLSFLIRNMLHYNPLPHFRLSNYLNGEVTNRGANRLVLSLYFVDCCIGLSPNSASPASSQKSLEASSLVRPCWVASQVSQQPFFLPLQCPT